MKKEIRVTKGQFERLIEQVHNQKYGKTLKENVGAMGEAAGYSNTPSSSPGVAAAEGLAVIINGVQKAWKYINDPQTKAAVKKTLAAIGSAAGSATTVGTRESRERKKPVISNKPVQKLVRPKR